MIIIYTIKSFSRSVRAKLQKRNRNGQFAKRLPTAKQVEKNPLATFFYPMSDQPWNSRKRTVRVISATPRYITGLEFQPETSKWKFKKFLQQKATQFRVASFNPSSMS
jgi:hypothetical protein